MQHIGTVYLSRQRPLASITSSGSFELQLAVYDRIHSRAVEPWRLIWAGPAAQAFWAAHQDQLLPGAALHVTCENARAHTITRSRLPITEIQAHIVQAQLHSPHDHLDRQTPAPPTSGPPPRTGKIGRLFKT